MGEKEISDSHQRLLGKMMRDDCRQLFSTGGPPPSDNLTVEDLIKTTLDIDPRAAWKNEREACEKHDRENRRGKLVLNSEVYDRERHEGLLIEKDDIEYRVLVDEYMRGMTDDEGRPRQGYFVKPLPEYTYLIEGDE